MIRIYAFFVIGSSLIGAQVATELHHTGWAWTGAALLGAGMTLIAWAVFFGQLWWVKRPPGPVTARGRRRRRDRALRRAHELHDAGEIDADDYATRLRHLQQWDGRS